MSIPTRILDALKAAELNAVLPGVRDDKCGSTYYVVTDAGRRAVSKNNALRVFYVTAYVPADKPSQLAPALTAAREALIGLANLRDTGEESEPAYDEEIEAVFAAIEYTALCAR